MPCAHEPCKCEDANLVVDDVGYCSESCAKRSSASVCTCDHEECLARQIRPYPSSPGQNSTFPTNLT
jgi:hypothetical protein